MKKMGMIFIAVLLMLGCPPQTEDKPVTGIKLSQSALILNPEESILLTATVLPADADNKSVVWKSANDRIATVVNGKVTGVKEGQTEIIATSAASSKISAKCTVTVNRIPTLIYRQTDSSRKAYRLVKAYDFTEEDKNLQLTAKGGCTLRSEIRDGYLIVTYPKGSGTGDMSYALPVEAGRRISWFEIRAKVKNDTPNSYATAGIGTADINGGNGSGWANSFNWSLSGSWVFRNWGANPQSLAYDINADTFYTYGIGQYEGGKSYSINGQSVGSLPGGSVSIPDNLDTYYFYFGQENGAGAGEDNIITVDYFAFYELDETVTDIPDEPEVPEAHTIYVKRLDSSATGKLNTYDTVTKEWTVREGQKYDLITYADGIDINNSDEDQVSGRDAYVLWHEDEFDYADMDELWNAAISTDSGKKAWRSDETWNVSSRAPFTEVKDGRLVLNTYRIDMSDTGNKVYQDEVVNHHTLAKNRTLANANPNRATRIRNNANSIVGGINFGEDWLYGYCEAELWVQTPRKYGNFWCGFYTLGANKVKDSSPNSFEQEFDIWEEMSNTSGDQILHNWKSDQTYPIDFVCNRTNDGRFHSQVQTTNWAQLNPRTPDGWTNRAQYIKAALAWTPEKVIFYLEDPDTGEMFPTRTIKAGDGQESVFYQKAESTFGSRDNISYIPDIPQVIYLVIASNNNLDAGGYPGVGGTVSDFSKTEIGVAEPFIYYESFKLYRYAGKFDGVQ